MPVPFKVKAVYEYRSEEPDDLIFDNGQIITVTEDDDADWYTGEYVNADGQKVDGIFPRNFVEKYEPAVPSRPTRAPRKIPQPEEDVAGSAVKEPAPTASVSPPVQQSTNVEQPAPQRSEPLQETVATSADPPATAVEESRPAAKKAPPVVEKPTSSSFKDRIAAFNKSTAAPVAPFKPGGNAGSGYTIKKPFVAPPPSRNAYVPQPREPPPQKVYRREEELEQEHAETESEVRAPPAPEPVQEENQPKPTSLKERIALLQQQQLESAQRQADSSKKKERPKRPSKPRTESAEALEHEEPASLERVSTDRSRKDLATIEAHPSRASTDMSEPTPASRELVSDTNDADDSGAADTEDALDVSTEEEAKPRSVKSPPIAAAHQPVQTTTAEEEEEDDTEEEEDPEARRKRELRERMAKMSGGMGMMGMFGAPAPPKKQRAPKEEKPVEAEEEEEVQRAPPVPLMALPGMSNLNQATKPVHHSADDREETSPEPTPVATHNTETAEDYIAQKPSRRSTERSQTSGHDRGPPPRPPVDDRPQPPSSPGARPMPPPPPPTRHDTQVGTKETEDSSDDEESSMPAVPPTRAVPPPPPISSHPESTTAPRAAPPVPMSPTSPQDRAPPPPPPGQLPSRQNTNRSQPVHDESDEEITEYDGDYDTDIASSAKHKAALKSHGRESSIDEGLSDEGGAQAGQSQQSRPAPPPVPLPTRNAPPPVPQTSAPVPREPSIDSPRGMPPPIPQPQIPIRESLDSPRAAPPPVPPPKSPVEEEEYDPYRYSMGAGLPAMAATLRAPTDQFEQQYAQQYSQPQPPQAPTQHAPPLPPTAAPPPPQSNYEQEDYSMSGALAAPKQSSELGRSNTTSRRSTEAPRQSTDGGFIAADIDLAQRSMWWAQDNNPPPALQGRSDVLWEMESSTTQKRGGKSSVSRDVYVLYQDYSQTTINATFDASDPAHVAFEQNHERPPMPPRKDQLEDASENLGKHIAASAEKASGSTVGEGTAHEFVLSLIKPLQNALLPVGTRSYGALVYANMGNASTQQFDEIQPGDIITFRNAKFAGHKGGLHQKYSQDVGTHVGVVIEWDGSKKKIRTWEQGNQEKGKKAKVRDESYRVSDLKSGEVRVWRVMPRSYVNWAS